MGDASAPGAFGYRDAQGRARDGSKPSIKMAIYAAFISGAIFAEGITSLLRGGLWETIIGAGCITTIVPLGLFNAWQDLTSISNASRGCAIAEEPNSSEGVPS
jgi:hypothetical protein